MSLHTYDRLTAALALLAALTACTGEEEVGSTSEAASAAPTSADADARGDRACGKLSACG